MTAGELLKNAVALMHEEDSEAYSPYAQAFVNLVLAELFEVNNRIRKSKGKPKLLEPPKVSSLNDEVCCEPELASRALIFGVLARVFTDEDNNPHLSMYKQEYANAINEADRGCALWVL